ncbi:hypothetical protein LSTR_LSTR011730 [Laodelphax striatellus]|uniref:G-protein coupled receptors family 2 profile 2 domain-containing protein n=1 Tax=Laodelphax striatellus TaxID=195883 RepID=A0A482WLY8_LAOST|nr:hypothetical protein LSTR_LSTR011730 [Laodelphax striatellus]
MKILLKTDKTFSKMSFRKLNPALPRITLIFYAVAVLKQVTADDFDPELNCSINAARVIGKLETDGDLKAVEITVDDRQIRMSGDEEIKFPPNSHKVETVFNETPNGEQQVAAWGCTCGVLDTCIPKCCPPGQVVEMLSYGICKDKDFTLVESHLKVYESRDSDQVAQHPSSGKVMLYHKMLKCSADGATTLGSYKLLKFGNMYGESLSIDAKDSANRIFNSTEYCIDFRQDEQQPSAFVCRNIGGKIRFYPYLYFLNSLFFVITFLVYLVLPSLRNSKGYLVLNYCATAAIGYASNAVIQIDVIENDSICAFVAYTIYFFLMASYFWLNVMCYDIYSAFKTMKSVARSKSKRRNVMIAHCCYAWGSPFIMLVFAYVIDMYGPDFILKPRMAVTSCWFGQTESLYMYFYGPMMILLAANMYFFAITIYKLYQVSKQTEMLKNTESKRHHQKEKDRCYLYGKLFVVMGVTWIMEVVSERIGGAEFWWYPTDIINICQGIGIFVIFVVKRRVLYMLNQKFCPSLNLINESEAPSSKPTSSTGSSSQNGNVLNGAALNGNATNGNAGNVYVGEEGYDNPIPMTPVATRVDHGNDVSVPIDDTAIRRY